MDGGHAAARRRRPVVVSPVGATLDAVVAVVRPKVVAPDLVDPAGENVVPGHMVVMASPVVPPLGVVATPAVLPPDVGLVGRGRKPAAALRPVAPVVKPSHGLGHSPPDATGEGFAFEDSPRPVVPVVTVVREVTPHAVLDVVPGVVLAF